MAHWDRGLMASLSLRLRRVLRMSMSIAAAAVRWPDAGPRLRLGPRLRVLTTALPLALSACGGGGGGTDGGPAVGFPASGDYAWLLRAVGSVDAPRFGLSLLHPQTPTVEYTLETENALLTDLRIVRAGSVDANAQRASAVRAAQLLYITAGDLRSLPLDANGSGPKTRVQRAGTSNLCGFAVEANDLAQPLQSRYIATTAGSDGRCDSSDDSFAEAAYTSTGALRITAGSGERPLAAARDATSFAPNGWITPRTVAFWSAGATGTTVSIRATGEPSFTTAVVNAPRAALLDDGSRLSIVQFAANAAVSVRPLDSALTGGGNWQGIGWDADAIYAFRNSDSTASARWSVLRVARNGFAVTALASGDGFISNAALGSARLFVTVLGTAGNRLLSMARATPGTPAVLETTGTNSYSVVLTSNGSVHQLFRASNIATSAPAYAVEFIDETGARLYTTSSGGYPLTPVDAAAIDFNRSENRSRFVFVSGYGSRGFADGTLFSYDTTSRGLLNLGVMPGTADYGQDVVYANATAGPQSLGGLFVARALSGNVQPSGSKVFSFDAQTAASLKAIGSTR
jgi:hypothetical protein